MTPILIGYVLMVFLFDPGELIWDEGRYLWFARNMLQGFYSPSYPDINLWNGPGYPMVIAPFLILNLPLMALRLFNVVLIIASLLLVYKVLLRYMPEKAALVFVVFLALYYPAYPTIPLIMTESLAWFMVSLVCWLFIKTMREKHRSINWMILSALSIAFLALVRTIFGYVIAVMIITSAVLTFVPLYRSYALKTLKIFALAMVFCLPYLLYTYSLTGKIFYWTDAGGMSLYTMSTPHENERGDWLSEEEMWGNPVHREFLIIIADLDPVQRDEAYKQAAIGNIKNHPVKFLYNWMDNVGRLLFGYPYTRTYSSQKVYFFALPNMFVFVFMVMAIGIAFYRYKTMPPELFFLLLFIGAYLFGSSLLSAYRRMFYITMPFWTVFIGYVYGLTTVKNCDVISLMERGRITDAGTYEELLARNERFREIEGEGSIENLALRT